tara:strand:+ start:882 stop:1139 length:258 start_codon:yes stop_codon:yes gene_type:complete
MSSPYYVKDMVDKKTEKRIQSIIDDARVFMQSQAEKGVDLVELAQVMLSMSRETMVDAYGEFVADTYIANQISKLKINENSLTLH